MPRSQIAPLTASQLRKQVKVIEAGAAKPRLIRVGGVGGLGLNVRRNTSASGPAFKKSWVLRWTVDGKRRDFGLGAYANITLEDARTLAQAMHAKIKMGMAPAPVEERRAKAKARTFEEAANAYFERSVRGQINARDEGKWFNDLKTFAYPVIGDAAVGEIETRHMIEITERPYVRYGAKEAERTWDAVPERARRCLNKIATILEAETRLDHRSGANPADWRGHLDRLLPKPKKQAKHQPALPYAQLPDFMAALRDREASSSTRGLEFLILTCARSGEVREATWSEIDMEAGVWTIPAARMKAKKDHRVALSDAAMAVLKAAPRYAGADLIFPGQSNKAMSDNTLRKVTQTMDKVSETDGAAGWKDAVTGKPVVPHGFRSTFRDWAAEKGVDRDIAEMALAHTVGSDVERAYRRSDMVERRRAVMQDWADFALGSVAPGLRVAS